MGQLVRQGGRFLAIYFSDLLLWLSLAGIFEVLFVLVAGVLCILTAGFIFESMKKHPVVMVLGTTSGADRYLSRAQRGKGILLAGADRRRS